MTNKQIRQYKEEKKKIKFHFKTLQNITIISDSIKVYQYLYFVNISTALSSKTIFLFFKLCQKEIYK